MFNQKLNKFLWVIFLTLIIVVIWIFLSDPSKNERTFRQNIVNIDTTKITEIYLFPKSQNGKEVKLFKTENIWKVKTEFNKEFTIPPFKIKNLLNQLLAIKPKRLASRSSEQWSVYQVDSNATRILVNEGTEETLNLIIGKFAFQQPRSMSTYVRLANDVDVYEVDGFLEMTFNKDANSFRDETIISSDKSNWVKLVIDTPNAESFTLVKSDKKWFIDDKLTDSSKTEKVLNELSRISNSEFANIFDENSLPPLNEKLLIESNDGSIITVSSFRDSSNYIIHSSSNPENYFKGEKISSKIFFDKNSLF